jgi:hypothetical protein
MADEKLEEAVPAPHSGTNYEAPQVEEVVTRENLEREVAYAGGLVGSNAAP